MSNRLTSPIPNDTREALQKHDWQIDNIALLLTKYLDFCIVDNKNNLIDVLKNTEVKNINFLPILKEFEIFKVGLNKTFNEKKSQINGKIFDLDYIKKLKRDFISYRKKILSDISSGKIRKNLLKIIHRQNAISDKSFTLTTQSRLVVGLGSGSVLETSIKLHHIYGIPYIPASAVKGVLKAYRIWKLAQWDENRYKEIEKRIEENKPNDEEEKNIIKIFGNQQQKGKLIILDAYPENFEGFDIDIMNPHFPDYYDDRENKVPPADWQNPRPITFLAIPEGTKFIFFFKNIDVYDGNIEDDLKEAFQQIGIGGKTSLGYGILEKEL